MLLVREWDAQTSGSGCCGRLSTEAVGVVAEESRAPAPYAHVRADMLRFGEVYRALWSQYGESSDYLGGTASGPVELTVVDPRNMVYLVGAIWRDARRRGLSVREAARQVHAGTAAQALVCDGVVLFSGRIPAPEEAVAAVAGDLESRR
ncbi:MAG: hypothetical protein GEV03_21620 [Streptosporangiales bacterium]|nr:hypothetical protein [Streptosporangiales bacterium]